MVIFYSYVKLPEGNSQKPNFQGPAPLRHPFSTHSGHLLAMIYRKSPPIGAPEINTNGRQNDHLPFQVPASWKCGCLWIWVLRMV